MCNGRAALRDRRSETVRRMLTGAGRQGMKKGLEAQGLEITKGLCVGL